MAYKKETEKARGHRRRREFLAAMAKHRDRDLALAEIGANSSWLYANTGRWADFRAAYQAIRRRGPMPGINQETEHSVVWDNTFAGFRIEFLKRHSPFFHVELCDEIDKIDGGDIMLVIWPPEHGKTSLFEDRCTMDVAVDPTVRITVGKAKIEYAEMVLSIVKNRLEPDVLEYWKLRERFGPFAPMGGKNAHNQQQTWSKSAFNVFKRPLGQERDFNMQALGMGSDIAGTRCDRLMVDDPQSRKTLAQTDKILDTLRDDWFSRPGVTGSTAILMNVVGDGDIAERLIDDEVCDHVTVLSAYNERYLDLGPRPDTDGNLAESAWLWPERYSEKDYDRLRRNAGPEGWARKYMQDWRPAIGRTFTQEMIDGCANGLRRIDNPPPRHPADKPGEIALSIDPAFKRTAVCAAAFEPTMLRVLDTVAQTALRTTSQMIDMLVDQARHWHRPNVAHVKWVVVETKGMAAGLVTDDAMLELQQEIGFEIIEQVTGWDKHDVDFGVAQMARSMSRREIDFPAGDEHSIARFQAMYREMKDWRPDIKAANRGNKLKQDELMALWFLWTRWHKQRRRSIRRLDAGAFGFAPPVPVAMPGMMRVPDLSRWSFGALPSRAGR